MFAEGQITWWGWYNKPIRLEVRQGQMMRDPVFHSESDIKPLKAFKHGNDKRDS